VVHKADLLAVGLLVLCIKTYNFFPIVQETNGTSSRGDGGGEETGGEVDMGKQLMQPEWMIEVPDNLKDEWCSPFPLQISLSIPEWESTICPLN